MEKTGRKRAVALVALLALTLAVVTALPARRAQAKLGKDAVTGMDFYYGTARTDATGGAAEADDGDGATGDSADGDAVDILSVTGAKDDTVFVEMTQGERTIASHHAFTLTDETADADNGQYIGVVSVTIKGFKPEDTYAVSVYADREQTDLLYKGTITPVYAQVGNDKYLIALRTLGSEKRAFVAPETVSLGNASYALASDEPVSRDPLTYKYELIEDEAIDGSVTYVDDEGTVLKTEDIANIAQGTQKTVAIPAVIAADDGALYRTVNFASSVTAAYPGVSDFVIPCKPLATADANSAAGYPYLATIKLVDASDPESKPLATDTVTVDKAYRYTPPARLYTGGKVLDTYVLSSNNSELTASGILFLAPSSSAVENNEITYTIAYDKLPDTAEATWTVVLVNGAADPKSSEREIRRETFAVKPGETATFVPESQLEVEGTVLVPTTTTQSEYTYTYGDGDDPVLYLYYVPDGYVAPEPYEIEVRYVNIANGEVLQTQTLTSRVENRDLLEIAAPESFSQDGVEYVRLDGQERSVWHSHYSSNRVYTFYYRDINDDLSANITISRLIVEYEDVQTTTTTEVDGGTTVTDEGTTSADDATATGAAIPDVDNLSIINNGTDATVVDGEGRDTNTMRIEDDETPLAGPGSSQEVASSISAGTIAGVAVAAAAGLGLLFFVVFKRRKDKAEDAE